MNCQKLSKYYEKIMLQHSFKGRACCRNEKEGLRYEEETFTPAELIVPDRRWQSNLQIQNIHRKTTIAVVGTHHGVGTTHIAKGITYCCYMAGMEGVYVEQTANQWLKQSYTEETGNYEGRKKVSGLLQERRFAKMPTDGPFYGPIVPKHGFFIRDAGVLWDGFCPEAYDKVLLVLGSRFWEERQTLQYIKKFRNKNCIFVCSATEESRVKYLAKQSGELICWWGYDRDTFHLSERKLRIVNQLMQ